MTRIRGRLRRRRSEQGEAQAGNEYVEIDTGELAGVFAAPGWLRDVGLTSWLLVGIALFLVGAVWLLALTEVIVVPLIAASVIAAVASPLVRWLERRHLPRFAGAGLVLLGIVLLAAALFVIILAGITSETSSISGHLADAKDTIADWLKDLGVDPTQTDDAKNEASSSVSASVSALLSGLGAGIEKLSSLAFFLVLTVLSLFFLLKDGPTIRAWGESHMGVPARSPTRSAGGSSAPCAVTFSASRSSPPSTPSSSPSARCILGVPLVGTIAVVTFLGAYIPYLGAWGAATFTVLLALGGAGPEAAAGMIVVQLLANGILQQLVQPFAMGAALGIHPLAVLVVTIAGGCLFGIVGLVLAAPMTSAVVRISADLARARAEAEENSAEMMPSVA